MHGYKCAGMHVSTATQTTHRQTLAHGGICVCVRTHTHARAGMHTHTSACAYVCVHTSALVHECMHTHTHTHIKQDGEGQIDVSFTFCAEYIYVLKDCSTENYVCEHHNTATVLCRVTTVIFFFCVSSYISGVHQFLGDFSIIMTFFFNRTIEVATFGLHGWFMLGVIFVAGIHPV